MTPEARSMIGCFANGTISHIASMRSKRLLAASSVSVALEKTINAALEKSSMRRARSASSGGRTSNRAVVSGFLNSPRHRY